MQTQTESTSVQREGEAEWQTYWEALNLAMQLSLSQRSLLAQALISSTADYAADTVSSEADTDEPLTFDMVSYLRQRPGSDRPAPTDEEVRQWIDEYRTEKYS
ncbi:MAG: hypothetical protein DLM69_08505 [Candidatus Chloroheliales bacterium]|nr:MAG: hypothetical protein DLM69_08505 [Chloroflexota bacterium]